MNKIKEKFLPLLKTFCLNAKKWLKHLKPSHYLVLLLILGIGIFNGITGLTPQIKQHQRERNIVKTFDQWWDQVGKEQFRSVGLEPTEKIKEEEFLEYREKYLAQNATFIIEDRIVQLKQEHKQWWNEKGGREQFFNEHGKFPTEIDYEKFEQKYIDKYTQQYLRYNLAFVPKKENFENIATSWLLFPHLINYVIFAVFFFFSFILLEKRWKPLVLFLSFILSIVLGGIFVYLLASTSFFDHFAQERYMGGSLTLAFMLGAAAFGPKRLEISQKVKAVALIGIFLDMATNWFLNPGIFGSVTILTPVFFGFGIIAGLKIETRKKTQKELSRERLEEKLRTNASRNPLAERKAKTRASIEEGFKVAKDGMMENAQRILQQALTNLLQEHPVDKSLLKDLARRMTSSSCYIDFSSNQWLEWGEIAKAKNAPEAAVYMLKKGLSLEQNPNFARRALYILGEICVNNDIEKEDGIKRLKKVISMNENDIMAKQAKRMLEKFEDSSETDPAT